MLLRASRSCRDRSATPDFRGGGGETAAKAPARSRGVRGKGICQACRPGSSSATHIHAPCSPMLAEKKPSDRYDARCVSCRLRRRPEGPRGRWPRKRKRTGQIPSQALGSTKQYAE
eukprot:scaffold831_cov268-Pinguiococcus_pyrenoidosus.AAC.21